MNTQLIRRLALPMALVAAAACETTPTTTEAPLPPQTARLRVRLTDAPRVEFASAFVTIGDVTLLPVEGAAIHIPVPEDGRELDLLTLRPPVTADLGSVDIPVGYYRELRVVVTDARVTLADGWAFADGTAARTLRVPSGASSGIKIKLSNADGYGDGSDGGEIVDGVYIHPGETVLLVDFDVHQNFRVQGNPDTPAGVKGVTFTPVLRAVVQDVAGSITGTVTLNGAAAEGYRVRATLQGGDPVVAESEATDAEGRYSIPFLAPGAYVVEVLDDFPAATKTVQVPPGGSATANFAGTST